MKLFSVELDNINGLSVPRVELNYKFGELDKSEIILIHDLISKCYVNVMQIYISKKEIKS
ncbi:hypothetical protein [Clostridium ihumii]|uniref:hypothetical protein n=1 Tax=Clostridium ihumii TaxID=1470356 RepID=UPI00055884E5|nr:hypothetical protein [Clostridium ihumii]